jgi:hypothetical protein
MVMLLRLKTALYLYIHPHVSSLPLLINSFDLAAEIEYPIEVVVEMAFA